MLQSLNKTSYQDYRQISSLNFPMDRIFLTHHHVKHLNMVIHKTQLISYSIKRNFQNFQKQGKKHQGGQLNTKKHHHANQRNKVILQYTAEQLHEGKKTNTGVLSNFGNNRGSKEAQHMMNINQINRILRSNNRV